MQVARGVLFLREVRPRAACDQDGAICFATAVTTRTLIL